MIQVGTKFSSKPRNGYDHVYEITDIDGVSVEIRNTSFPEYDGRGQKHWTLRSRVEEAFSNGDYIILN